MPSQEYTRIYTILQELVRRSTDTVTRMRSIEQRVDAMENRFNAMEEAVLEKTKKLSVKVSDEEKTMKDLNDEILRIKSGMERLIQQLSTCARKRDLKEIEKMVELLSPINHEYVTREELENLRR